MLYKMAIPKFWSDNYEWKRDIGEGEKLAALEAIKQFVVTKCSKERPGSIVTETLKNGKSLIPIFASKELYFYAYFKYISFIKFGLTHRKFAYFRK